MITTHHPRSSPRQGLSTIKYRNRLRLKLMTLSGSGCHPSEAKQRSAAAKAQALSDFKKRFPHAQMSIFQVQVEFDANRKALGRVLFPDGDGSWENPLIEDQKYWSPALKAALGVQQDGSFPAQLSLRQTQSQAPHPVPAIAFSDSTGQSIADLFNKQVKIYVTPTTILPPSSGRSSPRRRSSSHRQVVGQA